MIKIGPAVSGRAGGNAQAGPAQRPVSLRHDRLLPEPHRAVRAPVRALRDRRRALPDLVDPQAARGVRAHARDREGGAGRGRGVPAPAVHDDRTRRDRPLPRDRLLQPARLGHGDRVSDRRRSFGGRRLHRHERRRPRERPHGRGGEARPHAGAQRRVPRRLRHGSARRQPRPLRRRRLLRGAHRAGSTSRRTTRSTTSSASPSAARSSRSSPGWAAASTRRRPTSAPTWSARSRPAFPRTTRATRP